MSVTALSSTQWSARSVTAGLFSQEKPPEKASEKRSSSRGNAHTSIGEQRLLGEEHRASGPKPPGEVDLMAARCKALGIPVPLGSRGKCVLPGHHRHEAGLEWFPSEGFWKYVCPRLKYAYSVAEVRAFIAYRNVHRLGALGSRAAKQRSLSSARQNRDSRWGELLDCEAGLALAAPVPVVVPGDLSPMLAGSRGTSGCSWGCGTKSCGERSRLPTRGGSVRPAAA